MKNSNETNLLKLKEPYKSQLPEIPTVYHLVYLYYSVFPHAYTITF